MSTCSCKATPLRQFAPVKGSNPQEGAHEALMAFHHNTNRTANHLTGGIRSRRGKSRRGKSRRRKSLKGGKLAGDTTTVPSFATFNPVSVHGSSEASHQNNGTSCAGTANAKYDHLADKVSPVRQINPNSFNGGYKKKNRKRKSRKRKSRKSRKRKSRKSRKRKSRKSRKSRKH